MKNFECWRTDNPDYISKLTLIDFVFFIFIPLGGKKTAKKDGKAFPPVTSGYLVLVFSLV